MALYPSVYSNRQQDPNQIIWPELVGRIISLTTYQITEAGLSFDGSLTARLKYCYIDISGNIELEFHGGRQANYLYHSQKVVIVEVRQ